MNGCADVGAGLDVNAGADGSFFGVFDQWASVALFSKKIDIFQVLFSLPCLCVVNCLLMLHIEMFGNGSAGSQASSRPWV